MRGPGVKKCNNGTMEIQGNFDNHCCVTGKGQKKWKIIRFEKQNFYPYKQVKVEQLFIYRGELRESQIQGYGEFKWPDGRHYIGDFVNAQM